MTDPRCPACQDGIHWVCHNKYKNNWALIVLCPCACQAHDTRGGTT